MLMSGNELHNAEVTGSDEQWLQIQERLIQILWLTTKWGVRTWVLVLALLLTPMTLDKSLSHSVPQFPHW